MAAMRSRTGRSSTRWSTRPRARAGSRCTMAAAWGWATPSTRAWWSSPTGRPRCRTGWSGCSPPTPEWASSATPTRVTRRRSTSPPPTGSTGRRDRQASEAVPLIRADFALRHAGQLATMVPAKDDPLGRITDGALAARGGRVVWIGADRDLESEVALDGDLLDAAGACVIPGLVDAHTHPVFAGSRADEFAERVSGVAYQAQQSGERGIERTVRATREADVSTLLELAAARANRFLAHGTTTIA